MNPDFSDDESRASDTNKTVGFMIPNNCVSERGCLEKSRTIPAYFDTETKDANLCRINFITLLSSEDDY